MANVRNSNTFYIDTAYSSANDELPVKGIKVYYIIYTTSNATNQLVLADSVTGITKVSIKNATSGTSSIFRFDELPMVFPNGIRPITVTACTATLMVDEVRG